MCEENKNFEMLSQPLITEDGFINEASLNELEKAIKNMPKTYERLKNDKEWSKKIVIHKKQILGAFAKWAIRQSFDYPGGLKNVIQFLDKCLINDFNWEWKDEEDNNYYIKLSLCEINKALYKILYEQNISFFDNWNKGEKFVDLDALLKNVCIEIRNEQRENENFDKKFKEIKNDS